MFKVQLAKGHVLRRHKHHIRHRVESETTTVHPSLASSTVTFEVPSSETDESTSIQDSGLTSDESNLTNESDNSPETAQESTPEISVRTRPVCNHQPSDRLDNLWS